MAKRIIWAPQAVGDRIQILDYWYHSRKLDSMFKESVELLSEFSFLGRQVRNQEERVYPDICRDSFQGCLF